MYLQVNMSQTIAMYGAVGITQHIKKAKNQSQFAKYLKSHTTLMPK